MDDLDALRVQADALIEAGDPRGELIATAIALEAAPSGPLKQHHAQLLNAEIRRVRALGFDKGAAIINWKYGLVDSVHIEAKYGEPWFVPLLARDPAFARLRRLEVASSGTVAGGWQTLFEALRAQPLPLRELAILTTRARSYTTLPLRLGPIAPLLAALPRLELLQLEGVGPELERLAHPALRTLKLPAIGATQLPAFATFELPALEDLTLIADADPAGVLAARLPALRALALHGTSALPVSLIEPLAAFAWQLDRLSLRPLGDDWLKPLLAHASAFARLELVVRFATGHKHNRAEQLQAAFPKLIHDQF